MKSIACYFCQSPCYYEGVDPINVDCNHCAKIISDRVINSLGASENELIYLHMYHSINGKLIHVRLHLQENTTHIMKDGAPAAMIVLPGFPLNPSNIKKKLPIYLTFS